LSHIAPVVLFVLKDGEGSLRFFVHPELHAVVPENDFSYIQTLLQDYHERAKLHSESLFKKISSLGVGPLVIHEAGPNISEYPALLEMCSSFVQF